MTAQPQEFSSVNHKKKARSGSLSALNRPLRLRMDNQTEEVRIEIVPLIDVIFCILTFFILAAVGLSRQQAISVDLPKANTGTPQGREILVVSLDELGQIYIEKQPVVTKDEFLQKLQAYRQQNPLGVMALYASPNASYNEVVQVLDLLREVGGDRVALAITPGKSPENPDVNADPRPATGVPGFTPSPDPNSLNPGTVNPSIQPQLPGNFGQPQLGLPGTPPTTNGQPQLGLPGTPPTTNGQPQLGLPGTRPNTTGQPQLGLPGTPPTTTGQPPLGLPGTPPTTTGQPPLGLPGSSPLPNSGATANPNNTNPAPGTNNPRLQR